MDDFKMEGLELPDTGENYDDMPDASEGIEEESSEAPRPSDSLDNFSDLEMPVLSEMDGSDISAPAKQAEKAVSLDKPSGSKPVFEEMGGASAQTGANSPGRATQNRSAAGTYSSVDRGTAQSSSAPSYSGVYNNTRTNNGDYSPVTYKPGVENALDLMERERMEKYQKGKGKAKVLGIIMLVMAGLRIIAGLSDDFAVTKVLSIILGVLIAYFSVKFMKGSNKGRKNLGWLAVFDFVDCIRTIITAISTREAAMRAARQLENLYTEFGIETETTVVSDTISSIYTISTITSGIGIVVFGVMAYFFLLDSTVSDFACDD